MKNVPKKSMHMKSTIIREIIFMDRLLVKKLKEKKIKINTKRFWYLSMEEVIGCKMSMFLGSKNKLADEMIKFLVKEKSSNYKIISLRIDNVRENKSLEKKLKSLSIDLNIDVECIVRNMLQ